MCFTMSPVALYILSKSSSSATSFFVSFARTVIYWNLLSDLCSILLRCSSIYMFSFVVWSIDFLSSLTCISSLASKVCCKCSMLYFINSILSFIVYMNIITPFASAPSGMKISLSCSLMSSSMLLWVRLKSLLLKPVLFKRSPFLFLSTWVQNTCVKTTWVFSQFTYLLCLASFLLKCLCSASCISCLTGCGC